MGIVWEAYHKGVPLLGVPENPIDLYFSSCFSESRSVDQWAWNPCHSCLSSCRSIGSHSIAADRFPNKGHS